MLFSNIMSPLYNSIMHFVSNNLDIGVKCSLLLVVVVLFFSRFRQAPKASKQGTAAKSEGQEQKQQQSLSHSTQQPHHPDGQNTPSAYNNHLQQRQQLLKQPLKIKKEILMNFIMYSIVEWNETEILIPQKIELNFGCPGLATVGRLKDFFPLLMGNESGYSIVETLGQFEHFAEDEWVLVHAYATLQPNGKYRFRKIQKK
jgi:hypothetical protein